MPGHSARDAFFEEAGYRLSGEGEWVQSDKIDEDSSDVAMSQLL